MFNADPRALTSAAAAAVACGFTAVRGRVVERWGAGLVFAGWMLSPLAQFHPLSRLQWGVGLVDGTLCAALGVLAFGSDRWWPMPATSLMLLVLCSHFAFWLAPGIWPRPYFFVEEACGYLLLAVLVGGAVWEGGWTRTGSARWSNMLRAPEEL